MQPCYVAQGLALILGICFELSISEYSGARILNIFGIQMVCSDLEWFGFQMVKQDGHHFVKKWGPFCSIFEWSRPFKI